MGLAKAEQERFRDRYQALGPLVESGEINAAVLKGPMAALNEAYRELNVEGGASGGGEFPPPRDLERKPVGPTAPSNERLFQPPAHGQSGYSVSPRQPRCLV